MMRTVAPALASLLLLLACHDEARDGRAAIRIVGSSTVFPFTATVAERFVRLHPGAPAPVVESTGTGGGLRLFCAGVGAGYPDIADASRRMTRGEYDECAAHGVGRLLEIEIGRDGIAFVRAKNGPDLPLTATLLYRALGARPGGKPNMARTWRDLDQHLPATPIQVYGPPATSGTRDALAALVLRRGCEAVEPASPVRRRGCTRFREDGAYLDAGENDNLIVQKLQTDPQAIGVLGYGYLQENGAAVSGLAVDGVSPSYPTIASGRYPGSRPLYLYVKQAHLRAIPHLAELLRAYADSWAPGGPLVARGLIAAPAVTRARSAAVVAQAIPLDPASLK